MKPPFLRTAYNYDMNKAGDESALHCKDQSRTQQSFTDECDINTIVKKFNLTGQLPENVRMPSYQDFAGPFDFQEAMNAVRLATESFMMMPAHVRARFHNDPNEFVDFCSNDDNRQEAEKLGLVDAKILEERKARALADAKLAEATTPPPAPQNAPAAPKGA